MQARFHLASGQAVTQDVRDADDLDRLLQAAHIFAEPNTRLLVSLQSDRIETWHLSIP